MAQSTQDTNLTTGVHELLARCRRSGYIALRHAASKNSHVYEVLRGFVNCQAPIHARYITCIPGRHLNWLLSSASNSRSEALQDPQFLGVSLSYFPRLDVSRCSAPFYMP